MLRGPKGPRYSRHRERKGRAASLPAVPPDNIWSPIQTHGSPGRGPMLKLSRFLAPYRGHVALVLVLALAQSIGALLPPRLMADIVDRGIVRGDQGVILRIGGLMLLMSIVATLCAVAGSFFSAKVAP